MSRSIRLLSCLALGVSLGLPPAASAQAATDDGAQGAGAAEDPSRWGRTPENDATPAPSSTVTSAQLFGAAVRSGDGKLLGPLIDLGVDGRDGTVLFATIEAERSIGRPGLHSAVPVQILAVEGDGLALRSVSRARFAGGPRFNPDAWPDADDTVAYAQAVGAVWQMYDLQPTWNIDSPFLPEEMLGSETPGGTDADTATQGRARERVLTPEEQEMLARAEAANLLNRPQGVRGSVLLRADLFDATNQRCGRVRALSIDLRSGRIEYVLVALRSAGSTGLDESVLRPVPFRVLNCQLAGTRLFVRLSCAQLEQVPGFPADEWPDLSAPEWQQKLDAHFPPADIAPAAAPESVSPGDEPRDG